MPAENGVEGEKPERDFTMVYVGRGPLGDNGKPKFTHDQQMDRYSRAVQASLGRNGKCTLVARGWSCLLALEVGLKNRPQAGSFSVSGTIEQATVEDKQTHKNREITTPSIAVHLAVE